ncbi:MAG: NAD(P)H-hydrate dehydratase [Halobacteriota archaeon]|nr:NAD(P)H-hydrate dehydratase [Halobacteriota archaeon]
MKGQDFITSAEMSAIDMNCAYHGLSSIQLMENAGDSIAKAVKSRFVGGKVVIFAGRGNNGGDAFVAARHLKGFEIEILLLGSSKEIRTDESRQNFEIIKKSDFNLKEIRDSSQLNEDLLKDSDIIIDAIFGTGIRGSIREPESTAIDLINSSKAFVLAVDVPSGLDPDTGSVSEDKQVEADLTVTFHRMKKGLIAPSASKYAHEIEIADIGIPGKIEMLTGPGDVSLILKRRSDSHKGDNGKVLVIGGGAYSGAPALSALAALRTGSDWVTVLVPKNIYPIVSSFSPDLIVRSLCSDILTEADLPFISKQIPKHDAVVIGMGLGSEKETITATRSIIGECDKVVVDADGLYGLDLPVKKQRMIITPHAGEFSKITDLRVPDGREERIEFLKDFSGKNKLTVLLKGSEDIISDSLHTRINRTGNAGMTVGGTGDVLSGIVGALFAMTDNPFYAAKAGAFISGRAGDIAFEEYKNGLTATDVLEKIPEAII